jgi:hypothetical protein
MLWQYSKSKQLKFSSAGTNSSKIPIPQPFLLDSTTIILQKTTVSKSQIMWSKMT